MRFISCCWIVKDFSSCHVVPKCRLSVKLLMMATKQQSTTNPHHKKSRAKIVFISWPCVTQMVRNDLLNFFDLAPGDCIIYPSLVIYPNKCQQKKFVIFKFFLWVIPLINFLNNGFNIGAIYIFWMWCYLRGFSCGRVNCRPRRNVCCTIHRRAACHLCPL